MTKSELKNAMLDAFTSQYYTSELCENIDNMQGGYSGMSTVAENDVFVFLDDLSDVVIETLETNNMLKAKTVGA